MKNSIINGIFHGTKGNIETMAIAKQNQDNLAELSNYYDKLNKRFNSKQLKLLEKFLEVYDKNYHGEIDFYFKEGFKLGLLIAVECFENN